jgi:diguanylate cyclase (GGDEF)-like protein/PAS domain S-box-containing protein
MAVLSITVVAFSLVLLYYLRKLKSIGHKLLVEKELFQMTLLSVGDGVISTDRNGKIQVINKVAEELTGWTQAEAYGKPLAEVLNLVHESLNQKCESLVEKVLETQQIVELPENVVLISKQGEKYLIEDSAAPIKTHNNVINGIVIVFRDCTYKLKKQQEIEYLNHHDQLTGVYNRRYFEDALKQLSSPRHLPLSIIMIDVDGLKLINDAFGHEKGDELLEKVTKFLVKKCRQDDVVCRIGGDEFVVLLPKTNEQEVRFVIQRFEYASKDQTVANIPISISCGWATKNFPIEKTEDVFKRAEDSMYHKKAAEKKTLRHQSIELIVKSLFEKMPLEELHSKRVSEFAVAIAKKLGLSQIELSNLKTASMLHDIGKIAINSNVLDKPSALNTDEWAEIKRHPEVSYNILSSVNDYGPLAEVVLAHHERWDGRGYPRGLKGTTIPLYSRIIALADAYDAMMSIRPYREAMDLESVKREIEKGAGTQFDPTLAKIFLEILEHKE